VSGSSAIVCARPAAEVEGSPLISAYFEPQFGQMLPRFVSLVQRLRMGIDLKPGCRTISSSLCPSPPPSASHKYSPEPVDDFFEVRPKRVSPRPSESQLSLDWGEAEVGKAANFPPVQRALKDQDRTRAPTPTDRSAIGASVRRLP
jgi:hypothetical protein